MGDKDELKEIWGQSGIQIFQNGQPVGFCQTHSVQFEAEGGNEIISPSKNSVSFSAEIKDPASIESIKKLVDSPELRKAQQMIDKLKSMLQEADQNTRTFIGRWNRKQRREFTRRYMKLLQATIAYCNANGVTFKPIEESTK